MEGKIPPAILEVLSAEFARRHKVVPLQLTDDILKVGLCQIDNEQLLSDLEFLTGKHLEAVHLSEEEISKVLQDLYGADSSLTPSPPAEPCPAGLAERGEFQVVEKASEHAKDDKLRQESDELSVVALVNQIITEAIDSHASDIHIEAYEQHFRVRYRLDGVLQEVLQPPLERKAAIISRLKIMADLDIAEKRRPQDGRIRVKRGSRIIDIRVSTLPTDFGEKVVLRILDKSQLNLDLEKLGFEDEALRSFKQAIGSPHGMILVTGPTGSGKTTTLYATLNYLNSPELNILTIEDPIEYNLDGINQSQVKSDIGYTFAKALRSFLRQDPDIIMVGEIRDQETAEIAVRAALTGHLVLSTLHTNDAPSALTRLLDMGLEPFLISSSVKIVIAQRLVRKICDYCKTANQPTLNIPASDTPTSDCERCKGTGYSGRIAIFEVMPISPSLAELINRRATAHEIKEQAIREGMRTLRENAILKLKQGITTMKEVLRETEG
ncbi:GspE/PulE family protein [candidate division KSB1 bacterium]|nr:GspE/PulE family protein [candidate division KSB1 bacterium]